MAALVPVPRCRFAGGCAVFGQCVNGARRWLSFGGFSFQPAEFAKLLGIFVAANYLAVQVKAGRTIQVWSGPYFLMLIVAGLVELEPDMGTACIVFGVPFLMAFTVGIPWKHLKLLLIAVAILLPGLIVSQPYRLQRVLVTYDPGKIRRGLAISRPVHVDHWFRRLLGHGARHGGQQV